MTRSIAESCLGDSLSFRRQFLLAKRNLCQLPGWLSTDILSDVTLSLHPDLYQCHYNTGTRKISILGVMVDPRMPSASPSEIARSIVSRGDSLESAIHATDGMTGRWVVIWQNKRKAAIWADAIGARSVFYAKTKSGVVCGSQPTLINQCCSLEPTDDPAVLEFTRSPTFTELQQTWFGTKTRFKNCFLLLPNHYLDLESMSVVRFFPRKSLSRVPPEVALELGADLLKGAIQAFSNRFELQLPLTAGLDSRMLLAASRQAVQSMTIFVDKMGSLDNQHEDIRVPSSLAKQLGIPLQIRDSSDPVPQVLREALERNVRHASKGRRTRMILGSLREASKGLVALTGLGGELIRKNPLDDSRIVVSHDNIERVLCAALTKFGYTPSKLIEREIREWGHDLPAHAFTYPLLNLAYWEHRMGNGVSQYFAEHDLATETLSPFSNRELIATFLSVDGELRQAPHYRIFRQLVEHLWPAALSEPINPDSER